MSGRHNNHSHHGEKEIYHLHEHTCGFDVDHPHEAMVPPSSLSVRSEERRKLVGAIILTGAVMLLEVVGGIWSNSLALISDAGHMLSHLLALLISYLALVFSLKPPTSKKTFGFYRLEILAALLNGFLLLLVTFWIFYQAYHRFYAPQPVASFEMMVIALIGLAANLGAAFLLSGTTRRSINLRSAFLHLMGDTLSSVGVVAAAGVIYFTQWWFLDPLVGALLSFFILFWAFRLMIDSVDILLEATPKEIDPERVIEAVKVIKEVRDVHDVHVWTLTSGMYALSAHVAVQDMPLKETAHILRTINFLLCQRFKIGHAAIQFEIENASAPSAK
ncbi:MAG TPA: cation diffusion facilitator family transporter [Candidatus Manganitrophaceae bacterium]|nr:cation diffusion facilitator family transporter [Candidatus Manganitrophaceae bacterium]